ncbi:DUF6194 family protein [Halovulum sp. GXIMD14793]
MTRDEIRVWIDQNLSGLVTTEDGYDLYWFYDPDCATVPERRMPFATLMTTDKQDSASNLSREGIYRLNISVASQTYEESFGTPPKADWSKPFVDTGHDFTALDRLMPHPVYASMHWVCVLNPSSSTFATIRPLMLEAYELAAIRYRRPTSDG